MGRGKKGSGRARPAAARRWRRTSLLGPELGPAIALTLCIPRNRLPSHLGGKRARLFRAFPHTECGKKGRGDENGRGRGQQWGMYFPYTVEFVS